MSELRRCVTSSNKRIVQIRQCLRNTSIAATRADHLLYVGIVTALHKAFAGRLCMLPQIALARTSPWPATKAACKQTSGQHAPHTGSSETIPVTITHSRHHHHHHHRCHIACSGVAPSTSKWPQKRAPAGALERCRRDTVRFRIKHIQLQSAPATEFESTARHAEHPTT